MNPFGKARLIAVVAFEMSSEFSRHRKPQVEARFRNVERIFFVMHTLSTKDIHAHSHFFFYIRHSEYGPGVRKPS